MRRRHLAMLLAGGGFVRLGPTEAQPAARTWRLGVLSSGLAFAPDSPDGKALFGSLSERGFALGRNLEFVTRGAGANPSRLPQLVEELKATAGLDVVLTLGFPAAQSAKAAGLPRIVATGTGDPVATGLIESMARPGGTLTGISDDAETLSVKRLSLLKELLPQLKRVAMLWNRDDLGMSMRFRASAAAAQSMDVAVQTLGVRAPDDFDGVFEAMDRDRPDAVLMVSDALTLLNRQRVVDYSRERRLPAIYETDIIVRGGGLMSYGGDRAEIFQRVGALIERIFRGASPAELPFEVPTRYVFAVNLGVARALDLTLPPSMLARADEVIE
jgi:putative ABC transport system substrate-binding protein